MDVVVTEPGQRRSAFEVDDLGVPRSVGGEPPVDEGEIRDDTGSRGGPP
jgi:hypothetical protein